MIGAAAILVSGIAAAVDARTGIIPNTLTFPAIALGLLAGSPAGVVVCATPALLLFARGKLGGGDVKLLAAMGGLLGVERGLLVEALAIGGALSSNSQRLGPWVAFAVAIIARRDLRS